MVKKIIIVIVIVLFLVTVLASCAPGDGKATAEKPANFIWGVWHGWIAPVSLVIGLFNGSIRLYESINTGWWYDFGYYIAIVGGFGGLALFRRRKRRRSKD